MTSEVPEVNEGNCWNKFGIPESVDATLSAGYKFENKCDNPNTKTLPPIPDKGPHALKECLRTSYESQQTICINSCLGRSFVKAKTNQEKKNREM